MSTWQLITERGHNLSGHEVKHDSEEDADGQGGQSLPEEGEEHQGEAEPDQDGHEARQGRVPIPVTAGLAHQDAVEDKVPKPQLDTAILFILLLNQRGLSTHIKVHSSV